MVGRQGIFVRKKGIFRKEVKFNFSLAALVKFDFSPDILYLRQIFRCAPNERVEGGDFEKNDGTGGHSAFQTRDFLAEQVDRQPGNQRAYLTFTTCSLSCIGHFCFLQKNRQPTSLGAC